MAWLVAPYARECRPFCLASVLRVGTLRSHKIKKAAPGKEEVHNDLRHHDDGATMDVKASILDYFSEQSSGNSGGFRARRVSDPQPVFPVPPAQIEPGLAALPAPPVFVVASDRDGVLGAAGPFAQG